MFAFTSLAVLALALGVRAQLVVDTPTSATQCQPVTFNLSGGSASSYYVYVVDATNPCGDPITEIDNVTGGSFTYTPGANAAGKSVQIFVEAEDYSAEAWSGPIAVTAGSDSCEASGSSSSSAAAVPTTPSAARTTHAAATTSVPVNAASNNDSTVSDDASGASRVAVGVSGMLAVVGAAVVTFAL